MDKSRFLIRYSKWAPAIVGAIALATAIYSILQFEQTKNALLRQGVNDSVAQFGAWAVMLVSSSIGIVPLLRILYWRTRVWDIPLALATPAISFAILQLPANFSPEGQPLRYCAMRPDGHQFCLDHAGVDPLTGVKLEALTPNLAIEEIRRKGNLLPDPIFASADQIRFFDSLNGAPLVWYVIRDGGCAALFNRSGVDPITGGILSSVDRDVAKRLLTDQMRICSPKPIGKPVEHKVAVNRYFDPSLVRSGDNWTVVAGRGDSTVLSMVTRMLPQPLSIAAFSPAFYSEGLFDLALLGDASVVKKLELPGSVEHVILIKAELPEFKRHSESADLVQASQDISITIIEPRSGITNSENSFQAQGLGFSNMVALNRLKQDIEEKLRRNISFK
jgi:hypothetical protein